MFALFFFSLCCFVPVSTNKDEIVCSASLNTGQCIVWTVCLPALFNMKTMKTKQTRMHYRMVSVEYKAAILVFSSSPYKYYTIHCISYCIYINFIHNYFLLYTQHQFYFLFGFSCMHWILYYPKKCTFRLHACVMVNWFIYIEFFEPSGQVSIDLADWLADWALAWASLPYYIPVLLHHPNLYCTRYTHSHIIYNIHELTRKLWTGKGYNVFRLLRM